MARSTDFEPVGNIATYTLTGTPERDGLYAGINAAWLNIGEVRGIESFDTSSPAVSFSDSSRAERVIKRALFQFDFRERGDGQNSLMEHVKRIQSAKVTLNVSSVSQGMKIYLAEASTHRARPLIASNGRTALVKGYSRGELAREAITSQYTGVTGTGLHTWELPPTMLHGIERAMRSQSRYAIIALDHRDLAAGTAFAATRFPRGAAFNLVFSDFSSASTAPKLLLSYVLDNNRINHGGGISRSSKTGFMTDNVFSGTNSGLTS